ncbi:MAG: hypothetical protein AAFR64_00685 [Pseudomonadota bacterium]
MGIFFRNRASSLFGFTTIASAMLALGACSDMGGGDTTDASSLGCPEGFGWSEGLGAYLDADAELPTTFSANADDCLFHQWSWEAFAWATAPVDDQLRFMTLKTIEELDGTTTGKSSGLLNLNPRQSKAHVGSTEYAGAFVEADGSMLVGPNGYPVYASIHMNDNYFNTAKDNMIADGGYEKNAEADTYFDVGAAVFKATWYRLSEGEIAPPGAYTTQALVPVLKSVCDDGGCTAVVNYDIEPQTVTVALVGLHVVGYVENHPEFLWGTFEHNLNAPRFPDGTFEYSDKSIDKEFTFYKKGTPLTEANILVPNQPNTSSDPALLTFDETTQTFAPITQVVQMNETGGDNQTNGPANVKAVNSSAQGYLSTQGTSFNYADYLLIGTVWLDPNTYVYNKEEQKTATGAYSNSLNEEAVGGIALANSTAETFMQTPGPDDNANCFACHNAQSYNFGSNKGKLPVRRIAISHTLASKAPFNVPNQIAVKDTGSVTPSSEAE